MWRPEQATLSAMSGWSAVQSRLRKSAQGDKWSFCLTAGTLWPANQERPCRDDRAGTTHRLSRSHGEVDSDRHSGRVRLLPPTLEATMQTVADRPEAPTAIRTDLGAIFVSLELSRSTWLITSLSPGGGEKMSKQVVRGGDVAELLERFARLREKTRARTGKVFPFVVIQEAP